MALYQHYPRGVGDLNSRRAKALLDRWLIRAKSRRGIAAGVLAVLLGITAYGAAIDAGDGPAYGVLQFLWALVLGWFFFYWLIGWVKRSWEESTRPTGPSFTRPARSAGIRTMLKEDKNATFFKDNSGFLWRKRYWFVGTGCPPTQFTLEEISELYRQAQDDPVHIVSLPPRDWWLYQENIYWENGDYSARDVKALLLQRMRQERRQLERAHALMAMEHEAVVRREGISKEVKQAVFERDQGRCAQCGSRGPLEFDHIIPVAFGGATSVKNIQLLCLDCNREKGASL